MDLLCCSKFKSSLDFSDAVTGEDDAMDLFTPTSIGLDLQEAICILKIVTPFNFFWQRGQANKSKEKSIIQEKIFFHYLYKKIKSYVDYAYFEDTIKYHAIT